MFFPEGQVRVFLYGKPVSMRLSFDGLYALTHHQLRCDGSDQCEPMDAGLRAMTDMTEYRLLGEPECFRDIKTGEIRETYQFDGRDIGFLVGKEVVVFNDFTLQFIKDADEVLMHAYLDVTNLPVPVFRQIGAITGLPEDMGALPDELTVMVRFELLPSARQTSRSPGWPSA